MLAMLLLVGYVASTRYYRREMDVTTFMATICPIATVQAVRPNVERELLELAPGQRREPCAGPVQLDVGRHGAHAPAWGRPGRFQRPRPGGIRRRNSSPSTGP